LVGMAVWGQFEEVENRYIYIDHKKTVDLQLTRSEHFEPLKAALIEIHVIVNADQAFLPKQNQFCVWCPATKEQCQYSKKQVIPGK